MKYLLILLFMLVMPSYEEKAKDKQVSLVSEKSQNYKKSKLMDKIVEKAREEFIYSRINSISLTDIKTMLLAHQDTLSQDVVNTTLMTLQCAIDSKVDFNNSLIIIDYSLPTHVKRLWLFDLEQKKLLLHTYVSHGLKSGTSSTTFFSNKVGSKASSVGVYHTGKSYRGRHGLSLKLKGLEKDFNNNSWIRYVVMHSAWYVNKKFINKYGRTGRSWGCPAIPRHLIKHFIDNLTEHSFLIIYYPSKEWLSKSKFLNCQNLSMINSIKNTKTLPMSPENDNRGEILFIDTNDNKKREENEAILTISADNYKLLFKTNVPLKRMLRRQFNKTEHIAINHSELKKLDTNNDNIINDHDKNNLKLINFLVPVVNKIRGFYATEFESVNLGKIKEIRILLEDPAVFTTKSSIKIRSSERFIRWLGL